MNPDLQLLVQLQDIDLQLSALREQSSAIPGQLETLEKVLTDHRQQVQVAKERLENLKKDRRALEGDLELLQAQLSRHKDQLMLVKTNKEYSAMLLEIDTGQKEIRAKEDEVLLLMESIEAAEETIRQGETALKTETGVHQRRRTEIEAAREDLRRRTEALAMERDRLERQLPVALLEQYRRIASVRRGIAMAEARDQACQLCHVLLRPQVYNDLKKSAGILTCDSCNRILYYRESGDIPTSLPATT